MKLSKFLEPSPEQKAEQLRQLKETLGISDAEKYALYDLLTWVLVGMFCDQFHDAVASDPDLKHSYDLILDRYHHLEGSR